MQVESFRDIIDQWDSASECARDLAGIEAGDRGRIWRRRNRIPFQHWPRLQELWLARTGEELTNARLWALWGLAKPSEAGALRSTGEDHG